MWYLRCNGSDKMCMNHSLALMIIHLFARCHLRCPQNLNEPAERHKDTSFLFTVKSVYNLKLLWSRSNTSVATTYCTLPLMAWIQPKFPDTVIRSCFKNTGGKFSTNCCFEGILRILLIIWMKKDKWLFTSFLLNCSLKRQILKYFRFSYKYFHAKIVTILIPQIQFYKFSK